MTSCTLLELYQQLSVRLASQLPWSASRSNSTWLCQHGLLNHLFGQGTAGAQKHPSTCPGGVCVSHCKGGEGWKGRKPSLLIRLHCRGLLAPSEMVAGTVPHLRDEGDEIQGGPGGLRAQFGSGSPPAHKTIVRNAAE